MAHAAQNRHAAHYADQPLTSFPRPKVHPCLIHDRGLVGNLEALRSYAAEVGGVDDGVVLYRSCQITTHSRMTGDGSPSPLIGWQMEAAEKVVGEYVGHVSNVPGLTRFNPPRCQISPSWHVGNVPHHFFSNLK